MAAEDLSDIEVTWKSYFGKVPPEFTAQKKLPLTFPVEGESNDSATVAVVEITEVELNDAEVAGAKRNFRGWQVKTDALESAILHTNAPTGDTIVLGRLLPPLPFLEKARSSFLMQILGIRNAHFVLGGYQIGNLPDIPYRENPGNLASLAGLVADQRLSVDMGDWAGLHFKGDLGFNIPRDFRESTQGGSVAEELPESAKAFLNRIFDASVSVQGDLWLDEEEELLSVNVEWGKSGAGSFSLRPGADWDLSFKDFGVRGVVTKDGGGLNHFHAAGVLTLAAHKVNVEAVVDLDAGSIQLDVEPDWTINLGWLRTLGGEEAYARGTGGVLDQKSGTGGQLIDAGTSFTVKRVSGEVAWKPSLEARAFSVTIGNPTLNGQTAKWRLLGGELEAEVTAFWRKQEGESLFDCEFNGKWTWEGVRFSASLDTRSGGFFAQLVLDGQAGLDAFAKEKLFPGAKPGGGNSALPDFDEKSIVLDEREKSGKSEPERNDLLTKKRAKAKEIDGIKRALARPFEVLFFEVSGNYHDKSIDVQLDTAGFLGFRLRGRDDNDPHRVDARIGDLVCSGSYDQSSDGAWSLEVAGTIALLGGGEPKGLGAGARVEGKFGSKETELKLSIKTFDLGELLSLVLADEPPAVFRDKLLTDVELVYKASEKFSLKCNSDISLFGPVSLKGMEFEIVSGAKKTGAKKPPAAGNDGNPPTPKPPKPVNSGTARIGFGKKLVVELKVAFEPKQIKFTGSAKKVDVSDLIESFFRNEPAKEDKAPVTTPPAKVEEKDPPKIMAREITVELWTARERKKDAPSDGEEAEPAKDDAARNENALKEGNSLTVTIKLERGESEMSLLLLAKAVAKPASEELEWRVLFAGDLNLKFKSLPLLGDILGDEATKVGVGLHALYVDTGEERGKKADEAIVKSLFDRADKKVHKVWWNEGHTAALPLKDGFDIKAEIEGLPPSAPPPKPTIATSSAGNSHPPTNPTDSIAPSVKAEDSLTWSDLDLKLGPVQLSRIGYGMIKTPAANGQPEKQKGLIAMDAALDLKVLRLAVVGLGLEVEIPSFEVTPRLEGLAINVRNGPVEITGALTHRNGVFAGLAQIKTANMTLGATGRFSMQDSRPSFFIYCVYASTLGGPPAFFVEGLAGGMGYDTRLVMPKVEDVPKFALVKAAKEGLGGSPEQQIAAFDACIVSAPHNLWFAAGVRFSTFKILNSVVVVALSISPDDVEVDIFGVMSLRMPPQPDGVGKKLITIASADLAIRGKISTKKGEIWLRGQIMPGAFIFDPDCRIVGGFAFQMWFAGPHKGDFAATIGGYHPAFKKPEHYFDVPRFGIEWQLTKELSIKGGAYMAITSRALMAGGRLEILYQSGSVRACFVAEAHFLAEWAPLRYMADVRISVDASFTLSVWGWSKEFSVHVAAQLHLEGPPFSGFAKIELGPIDITIRFGEAAPPPPLTWDDFAKNFLPERKAVIALRGTGLNKEASVKEVEPSEVVTTRWVLVPGQAWELSIETCIPTTSFVVGTEHLIAVSSDRSGTAFHAVPALNLDSANGVMNKFCAVPTRREVKSEMTITAPGSDANDWISAVEALGMDMRNHEPIVTPVAPALWAKEPPASGKPVSPDKDPRLDPTLEKTQRSVFGVTLRGIPTKFKMTATSCPSGIPKEPRTLQEPGRTTRNWERCEEDPFSGEGAVAYVRLPYVTKSRAT